MNLARFFIIVASIALFADASLANTQVVAKVNGKPLTAFELNEEFQALLPSLGSYHGNVSEERIAAIRKEAMDNLIDRELQYQYALGKNISVSNKEVEAEFTRMENAFGSPKKFKEAIKKKGLIMEEVKGYLKKRLLTAKAKEQEITAKARISDEELRDYYQKNKNGFNKPEELRASHILIGVDPAASAEEREKKLKLAKDILAKIKAGEDFVKLAMRYSTDERTAPIGGDIGPFHKGMMADEALEKAVLSLKVGEVSDVVESLYGYHIIVLTDRKPPTQLSFDDVRVDIKVRLEKKKADELYKKWMEDLKAKAKIEFLTK